MPTNMCVICGSKWLARKSNRSFFKIPNLDSAQLSDTDKSFLKRRREAWLGLIGQKFKKYNGKSSAHVCVCSDHFHSGKNNRILKWKVIFEKNFFVNSNLKSNLFR